MRTAQEFGSGHTKTKLDAVQKYLSAFTTALKKQQFTLLYIDACAGSGASVPKGLRNKANGYKDQTGLWGQELVLDADHIVEGSPRYARQKHSFDAIRQRQFRGPHCWIALLEKA